MRTPTHKTSLIAIFASIAGLAVIVAPVSGEMDKMDGLENIPVAVAKSDVPSWSERRANYVKP